MCDADNVKALIFLSIGSNLIDGLRPFCIAPIDTWESSRYRVLVLMLVVRLVFHLIAASKALSSRLVFPFCGECGFPVPPTWHKGL